MVLRLTDVRARKLASRICQPGEYRVGWKASRWDGGQRRGWPAEAVVEGRLIAARVGRGQSKQWLYLFTTLALPDDDVFITSTPGAEEMMEKEILMSVSAYNLVRALMCLAARRSRIDPRQLSFTQVLNVVDAAWAKLMAAPSKQHHDQEFFRVLDLAAQCTLPKRRKHRSYPRLPWRRGGQNHFRKVEN